MAKTIVIFPGGFHPFHKGHLSVYQNLVDKFPQANVYIASSPSTKERPFPFAKKKVLATAAGVPPSAFVEVKSPYKSEEITANYNPDVDHLIFALSQKDAERISFKPKKDGSPSYFQKWKPGVKLEPFSKHGYIYIAPVKPFEILGKEITSASAIRDMYTKADNAEKLKMIKELYPKGDPKKIKAIFDGVLQEGDIPWFFEDNMPARYKAGLSKSTAQKRKVFWKKLGKYPFTKSEYNKAQDAPGDTKETHPSKYTTAYKKKFGEEAITESAGSDKALKNKAEKSGIPYGILKQVYNRGLAAWVTGHRPGASQAAWGMARVNSFILKGKTWKTADADLAKKVRKEHMSYNKLSEAFSPDEMEIANKTARAAGAVSARAIVPRYVADIESKHSDKEKRKILDFGSGHEAMHTMNLRKQGLNVTAHEFGSNVRKGIHDPNALEKKYNHVFASNVLNVQSSKKMMEQTLDQIHDVLLPGGEFTGNFPESPRKSEDIDADYIEAELKKRFKTVERVKGFGTRKAPLFHAVGPMQKTEEVNEHIVKTSKGYVLYSKSKPTKKLGGPYPSKSQAIKRERQVQYFKHMGEENKKTFSQFAKEYLKEDAGGEGGMILSQLQSIHDQVCELMEHIKPEDNFEGWVQSKITLARDYVQSVYGYLMYNPDAKEEDDIEEVGSTEDIGEEKLKLPELIQKQREEYIDLLKHNGFKLVWENDHTTYKYLLFKDSLNSTILVVAAPRVNHPEEGQEWGYLTPNNSKMYDSWGYSKTVFNLLSRQGPNELPKRSFNVNGKGKAELEKYLKQLQQKRHSNSYIVRYNTSSARNKKIIVYAPTEEKAKEIAANKVLKTKWDEIVDVTLNTNKDRLNFVEESHPTHLDPKGGQQVLLEGHPIPDKVKETAKEGIELRKEYNRGGTPAAIQMARDLITKDELSLPKIKAMKTYFFRNKTQVQKGEAGHRPSSTTIPSDEWIAWQLYGGNPGRDWAERILNPKKEKEDQIGSEEPDENI